VRAWPARVRCVPSLKRCAVVIWAHSSSLCTVLYNRILLVDRLWIGRMTGHPCHVGSLDQALYRDFEQLRTQQRETDADLLHRVRALTARQLSRRIDYVSLMTGQPKSLQLGTLPTHVFHHQTHHRGQITTLLSQLGSISARRTWSGCRM